MDQRSRLEHDGAGKTTNGKNNPKEAALDKIRQMEWMRNKQDTWHLARADSRKEEGYVKKKYNKDEDSYFEGTGNQKSKKVRKPRQVEKSSTTMVSSSFAQAISSAPPTVNAWAQKKGSALFNREPEEDDEEDETLQMVLKESLKTAEEDQRRHIQRMKMNKGEVPTFHSMEPTINDWKVQVQNQYSPNSSANNRDLQFIDSDSSDEAPPPPSQRRKPPQSRNRKSSNPNEKPPAAIMNSTKPLHSLEKTHSLTTVNDLDNSLEPSQPHEMYLDMNKPKYDQQSISKEPVTFTHQGNIPSKITSVDNLSLDFSSNLTFGVNQNFKESNYDNYNHISQDVDKTFHVHTQSNERSKPTCSMPVIVPNSTKSIDTSGCSESADDTDRILHSFIRHDPPSGFDQQGFSEFYSKSNPQVHSSNDLLTQEHNQFVLNGLIHDSSMKLESNSPFQNVSPYGSLGKETLAGLPQNLQQLPPPFSLPYVLQNNQDVSSSLRAMQVATSHNLTSHMTYGISPGYPLGIQSIPPGLNQFGYPNTDVVSSNLPNLTPQQLAMNALHQQTQLTGMETIRCEPNVLQNQPKMMSLGEHQSQVTVSQNQLQIPVNQPMENVVQKTVEPAHETNQISPGRSIQQPTKTREELQHEYFQALQHINNLKLQLANSAPPSSVPEHQLYNYPCALRMPIGGSNNMLYPGVQMMFPSQQAVPTTPVTQESPNIQPSFPDFDSLLNTGTGGPGSASPPAPAFGRGRGRLQ